MSTFKKIAKKFRYGLVTKVLLDRLAMIGIEIIPYYWTLEGVDIDKLSFREDDFKDYSFKFFDEKEIKKIGEIKSQGTPTEILLKLLKDGKKCFGATYKGQIASFTWLDFDECNFKVERFPLKKDEVYMFNLYTDHPFRGKGLAPYIRYRTYQVLNEMGYKKIFSVTEYFNSSSKKFKKKLNAKFTKLAIYISLFHKYKKFWTLKTYPV